jgi:hypothetical protein
MCMKKGLVCLVVLLTASVMTSPCYCGVTATLSPIAHSWPNIAGSVPYVKTYSDPNTPGSSTGDYVKIMEDINDRAVCQTFTIPADSNGLTMTSIVITVNGAGAGTNLPMSLHVFDMNQLMFHAQDSSYNLWYSSMPRGYDFLPSATFVYPRNTETNDMFLQFDFNTNSTIDLEPNHIYTFEIWPTKGDDPGWSWLRDAEDNPYPGGSAYKVDPPNDYRDLTVDRDAISAGTRDMVMGVYGIPCDGNAFHPMPQDYSTDVALNTTLTWHAGRWAGPGSHSSHNIYLSANETYVRYRNSSARIHLIDANFPDPYNPSYTPTGLLSDTVYYWRVDEYNDLNNPAPPHHSRPTDTDANYWGRGDYGYWRFKTQSVFAKDPVPTNSIQTKFPPFNAWISWTKGCYAAAVNGHQVYFGTSFNDVSNATTATSVIYRGAVSDPCYPLNKLSPDYTPLTSGTIYYWRIDEVSSTVPPYLWKGPVWNFTYLYPQPVWGASGRIFLSGPPGSFDETGVKDPSIVYSGGKWHLFYTARGGGIWRTGYASATTIPELKTATHTLLTLNAGSNYCAPQVFWFEAKGKWYLIYWSDLLGQGVKATFSTNTDIDNPSGWTAGADMGFSETGALDFWCISDGDRVYCFYAPENNTIARRSTTIEDFPYNWSAPDIVVSGAWEASHVYKNIADGNYYMMVQAVYGYFELWTATSLGGTWTQIEEKWAAIPDNVTETKEHWTIEVCHGEIIRAGVDEKLEIYDINNCEMIFQGTIGSGSYNALPYRLGMLWKCHSGPADIDHDCDCDFGDFAVLSSQWLQWPGVPSADIAPPGGDGIVDMDDLSLLVDYWLSGREQTLAY